MIIPFQEEDLQAICDLEAKCFKDPWKEKDFLYEWKENPFSQIYVYKKENQICGYAILWTTFEIAQIANIGVDPACRNQHIGFELMTFLQEQARENGCEFMSLEVRMSNKAAIGLYEKCGFIQVNISKRYYPDGEDALVMTAAL